jgi:hypothetical protein
VPEQDSTGLPNVVYLFLVGILMAQGTFIGFEACAPAPPVLPHATLSVVST